MPGEWAKVRGTVRSLWPLGICLVCLGAFAAAAVLGRHPEVFGALFAASAIAVAIGWRRGLLRVESFFKGARGEERVSGILTRLPESYHVFNDFVAGGKHVDHVVAGPAGVFAVETKYWRGAVTVEDGHVLLDGQLPDRDPLAQALKEAQLVKASLAAAGWNGSVTPVLAFASDTFRQHIAELHGAVVINSCELAKSFATEKVVIPPAELERLVALMESNS